MQTWCNFVVVLILETILRNVYSVDKSCAKKDVEFFFCHKKSQSKKSFYVWKIEKKKKNAKHSNAKIEEANDKTKDKIGEIEFVRFVEEKCISLMN